MSEYVSKEELKEFFEGIEITVAGRIRAEVIIEVLQAIYNGVMKLPTTDAEPVRHGKWIYGNDFHWYTASCNRCGYQRRTDIKADRWNQWNYCPNCGARMDAEDDKWI